MTLPETLGGVLVNPLHWYHRPDHLVKVAADMERRGPPVLRAHFDGEVWHAREGTHRLRAALALGLAPVLVPVPWHRTRAALVRAQHHARRHGHLFARVVVRREMEGEARWAVASSW